MSKYKLFGEDVSVERINNDSNGNPRYVIHFLAVSSKLKDELGALIKDFDLYETSVKASGSGFKRYHNKSYGGGICFQSYNVRKDLDYLESNVNSFIEKAIKKLKLN